MSGGLKERKEIPETLPLDGTSCLSDSNETSDRKVHDLVPRAFLEEYGSVINLAMKGFDRCKGLLASDLFHTKRNQKLAESANYVLFLGDQYGIRSLSAEECRCVLYDRITPSGETISLPEELETIGKEWEIIVQCH